MNLDNEIVGYDADGNPVPTEEYIADIKLALKQFKDGTLEAYTHDEVRRKILGNESP